MLDPQHLIIAGAGAVEIVERARPVEGDRDEIFRKALTKSRAALQGQPLVTKAQPDDNKELDLSKPESVTALIKRAHGSGAAWNPFAADQHLAKSASIAAGGGRVVKVTREGGEVRFTVEHAS